MAEVLKKFGRYFLLDQIAQGGMAEIYRARMASTDGARRFIVIKRIQAGYGNNTEFLQMFRSEIKVTMGFNHPNIVQLYDFGEEQGQPYIAMELVDGKNLRQFMNRFGEMKQGFPIDLAVYIIEQAASGLHYAHSFKDKITGESLNIVHRDVSPQNILISYEGNIKVIDFGIAKATTNSESTRAGVIKGKPSYLSPEQISGEPLDGRSDIFALGIVLWELLVGRKLFAGDNDLQVLKLIESSQSHVKAPSTYNETIPKELDYIVLKALAKQREKRYQTAEELQRALHRFLYSFDDEFNPTDLSYSAKDMFKNEIVEDRKRIQKLNEEVEKLLMVSEVAVPPQVQVYENEKGTPTDRSDHTTHTSTLLDEPKPLSGARDAFATEIAIGKTSVVEFDTSKQMKPKPKERKPYALENVAPVGHRTKSVIPQPEKKGSLGTLVWIAAAAAVVIFGGPSVGIDVVKIFNGDRVPGQYRESFESDADRTGTEASANAPEHHSSEQSNGRDRGWEQGQSFQSGYRSLDGFSARAFGAESRIQVRQAPVRDQLLGAGRTKRLQHGHQSRAFGGIRLPEYPDHSELGRHRDRRREIVEKAHALRTRKTSCRQLYRSPLQ